ncbi:MAG: HAD-IC family P-type ATPase, partial [Microcoleus sp. T3-bin5]|nr:HAD-IC family P-type ATPase [Microcoleus sp. T3-bin5]
LQVDESALTGESLPVEKITAPLQPNAPLAERLNMAFAGSFVTFGQGSGIVVATGSTTEVGQISKSLDERNNLSTPLTRKFDKFSKKLLYIILALAALTLVVGWAQGQSFVQMFEAAVALAVSAIPEGLPAVVTVTLAIGVNRMARRHAIIRKLPAVETLGGATVICSDKTGTLTENQMTVQAILAGGQQFNVSGTGYNPEGEIQPADERTINSALQECLIAGLLCNDSHLEEKNGQWVVVGDPTEGALIAVGNKARMSQRELAELMPKIDAIPFESQFQYMATLHGNRENSLRTIYVKGSVEAVLRRCQQVLDASGDLVAFNRESVEQKINDMAT